MENDITITVDSETNISDVEVKDVTFNTIAEEPMSVRDGYISFGEEKEPPPNKFTTLFNKEYGTIFDEIQYSGIISRFALMEEMIQKSESDINLTDSQKELLKKLQEAFLEGSCVNGPPQRLMEFLDKKPNLTKLLKPHRIKRTLFDVSYIPYKLGFKDIPKGDYIPLFFSTMAISYGYHKIKYDITYSKKINQRNTYGFYLTALISKYAVTLHPEDYVSMYFVLSFLKNLSVCAITKKALLEEHPELKEYANNLFMLMDKIVSIYLLDSININEEELEEVKPEEFGLQPTIPGDNVIEL